MTRDLFNEPLRRRELLQGGAGLALALGLAGCGVGDEPTSTAEKAAPAKTIAAKPDGDLVYFNWSEYLDPQLIKDFEKRYGVKVRESNFDSMNAMMAKLRSGNKYDVIFPTADWAAAPARGQPAAALRQGAAQEHRTRSTTTSPSPGTTRPPSTRCPTRSTRRGSSTARTRSS